MAKHKKDPPWFSTLAIGKTQVNTQVPKPVVEKINNSKKNETKWIVRSMIFNGKIKLEWDILDNS